MRHPSTDAEPPQTILNARRAPAAKNRSYAELRESRLDEVAWALLAIAYVWWCAITGRRDRLLCIAVTTLIGEGVLVTASRGDCPLRGLQERLGDPVPLFELVLSPGAAKRAVTTMGAITSAGLVLLVVRSPRDAR